MSIIDCSVRKKLLSEFWDSSFRAVRALKSQTAATVEQLEIQLKQVDKTVSVDAAFHTHNDISILQLILTTRSSYY